MRSCHSRAEGREAGRGGTVRGLSMSIEAKRFEGEGGELLENGPLARSLRSPAPATTAISGLKGSAPVIAARSSLSLVARRNTKVPAAPRLRAPSGARSFARALGVNT